MLSNFLKIGIRSLWKNKVYSFINIAGLSLGIAVCILILTFVSHEYSFNRFHSNFDRIFLNITRLNFDGRTLQRFSTPEFGPSIKESNPAVINYCRLLTLSDRVIKSSGSHRFSGDRVLFADSSFFTMFSFELLKGNRTSLAKPYAVFLTEESAVKYFGDKDPIGQTINFDKGNLLEVVGIVKKAPSNSTIQYDLIASINSLEVMPAYKDGYLGNPSYQTYLLLKDPSSAEDIESSMARSAAPNSLEEEHILEPLSKIHFNNTAGGNANIETVFIFLCIAALVLALAIINYANLTTARATVRAKEVGIRKISGAGKRTLSLQFYIESVLITSVSFAFAFVFVELLSPVLKNVLQQNIDRAFFSSPLFVSSVVTLFVLCVLLSGSYPALLLPKFKPVDIMKGKIGSSGSKIVRNGLTTFQFGISLILVVCSFIVQNQLDFLSEKEIGLQKEQVMVIPVDAGAAGSYTSLKNEIRQQRGVAQVGAASIRLYHGGFNLSGLEAPVTGEPVGVATFAVDQAFFETLGLKWKVQPEKSVAPGNYLLNEVAADKLGIKQQPLGNKLSFHDERTGLVTNEVAGVVQDFNFTTLKAEIDALVMAVESDTSGILKYGGSLYVRLDPSHDLNAQIQSIRNIYEKYQAEIPFEYYFLDDAFDELYKNEQRLSSLSNVFTGVAVFIACLGLFGLVTFITERRTKEIGIRKVLGASVNSVLMLISKDIVLVMIIAIGLSAPIAYFVMNNWLENFAYKIEVQWTVFLIASVSLLLLALLTVSYQALKAAFANPVNSLRND